MGGLAMFLFTISGILTVFSLLWTTYAGIYLLYDTKSLFIDGTPRFFPSTIYMNSTGAAGNVMTPSAFEKMTAKQSFFSIVTGPFAPFLGPIKSALGFVVDTKCAVEKVIPPVVDAVQKTIPPAVAAVASTAALVEKAPQLLSAADSISAFTDPAALRAAAQKGGAVGALEVAGNLSSYVFFGTAVVVLVGALTLTWARLTPSNKSSKEENTNDVPPDVHNDTPPGS